MGMIILGGMKMKELTSLEDVKSFINDHELSFIYVLTDS